MRSQLFITQNNNSLRFMPFLLLCLCLSSHLNSQCFFSCGSGGVPTATAFNYPASIEQGGSGFNFDLTVTLPVCTYTAYTGNFLIKFLKPIGAGSSTLTTLTGSLPTGSSLTFTNINFPDSLLSQGFKVNTNTMQYAIIVGLLSPPACPHDMNNILSVPAWISIDVQRATYVIQNKTLTNKYWVFNRVLYFTNDFIGNDISIYDLTGKLLFTQKENSGKEIDLSFLTKNQLYILKIDKNNTTSYEKIIIQNE